MSIEQGPSPEKMEITQPEDHRVKDIEQAWIGAHAEKPIHDLAREEGVSEEEEGILARLAERRGERAMQEYATEKEKNPIERLFACADKLTTEMREKGLEQDAAIVEKIKDRFNRYAEALRKNKEGWEEKMGKRASPCDLRKNQPDYRISDRIPVTHQIGEGGGWIYWPDGFTGSWFGEAEDIEKYKDKFEKYRTERSAEIVNFGFSKQGETEFYRALGVLGESEETIDIPAIYEKALIAENKGKDYKGYYSGEARVDPRNYEAHFPTNIEGVRLGIKKERQRSYDGKKEERISLEFDDNLIEEILAKK